MAKYDGPRLHHGRGRVKAEYTPQLIIRPENCPTVRGRTIGYSHTRAVGTTTLAGAGTAALRGMSKSL